MSQYPPPNDPLSYATPELPPPSPRPTSVTVLAILAIIFGSIGVLVMLCTLPQYMGMSLGPNPVIEGVRADTVLFAYTIFSLVLGLVMAIALLWSGIGALSLKPGARKIMIGYAIVNIVTSVLGIVVNLTVINPRMQQVTQKAIQGNPQLNSATMKQFMQIGSSAGICFAVVLLIWPALILYYMTRPHVKAAFERGMSGFPMQPPAPFPQQGPGGPYPQ